MRCEWGGGVGWGEGGGVEWGVGATESITAELRFYSFQSFTRVDRCGQWASNI